MKVHISSILLVLVTIGSDLSQGDQTYLNACISKYRECDEAIFYILQGYVNEDIQAMCSQSRTAYQCLVDYKTDCVHINEEAWEEKLRKLRGVIDDSCNSHTPNEYKDMEVNFPCLTNFEDNIHQCALVSLVETYRRSKDKGRSNEVITCTYINVFFRCATLYVRSRCCEDVVTYFKAAMDELRSVEEEQKCRYLSRIFPQINATS